MHTMYVYTCACMYIHGYLFPCRAIPPSLGLTHTWCIQVLLSPWFSPTPKISGHPDLSWPLPLRPFAPSLSHKAFALQCFRRSAVRYNNHIFICYNRSFAITHKPIFKYNILVSWVLFHEYIVSAWCSYIISINTFSCIQWKWYA